MENYKEKYNAALEKAKEIVNNKHASSVWKVWLYNCFPELKESEDERIKKAIHIYLDWLDGRKDYAPKGEYSIKDMIAWLEKQCKQKSIWHNEDEEPQRGSLILLIMQSGTPIVAKIIEPNHTFNRGERWAYIDDLLEKQGEKQNWKPSKEQINALEHFVRSVGESGYASPYNSNTQLLYSLLNDLYKLEKQGEQKHVAKNIVEIWKDMRFDVYAQADGNKHEPNCADNSTKMFSLNDIDEIIEKISEQKLL